MSDVSGSNHPLDSLVEEFVARYRRGERPGLTEFIKRHPELAEDIRELFPALVVIEQARPDHSESPGAGDGRGPRSPAGRRLERLGDYRILREIGRGGMGIVYEAEQESLGRHVALKVLPAHAMLHPSHFQRFQREARAAAGLHHTNIVPVFGVGEHGGLHYFVMQFIQGLGLDEVLVELKRLRQSIGEKAIDIPSLGPPPECSASESQSPVSVRSGDVSAATVAEALLTAQFLSASNGAPKEPAKSFDIHLNQTARADSSQRIRTTTSDSSKVHLPGQSENATLSNTGRSYWLSVARIGMQVADALAYANGQGVMHRDIKPSNLLLDVHGTVWVADFGLAKANDSDDLTRTGDIVGTLRYLAPERLRGESDMRGDIYSLGATLYELLTLRSVFDDSDRNQLIRKVTEEEPPRPRSIDATIPHDLETIVLKAIAKEPSDRYQSAGALATDLRHFLEDKPIRARRVSRTERIWRWCRRNPLPAGLSAALFAMALILGGGTWLNRLMRIERDRAVTSEQRANAAEKRALDADRESTIRKHLAQANAFRQTGQVGQRFKCLDEVRAAAKLGPTGDLLRDLRHTAVAAMSLTDIRPIFQRSVKHFGYGSFDHRLECFANIDFWGDKSLTVKSIRDGHELFQKPGPDVAFWYANVAFSPDDRYLFVGYWLRTSDKPLLHVWDLQTKELILSRPIRSNSYMLPAAVHPNGRWLVFPLPEDDLAVWDLAERRELRRLPLDFTPYSVRFDRIGKRLAANNCQEPEIRILDFETGMVVESFSDHVGQFAMIWSADDQLLASAHFDGQVSVWHVAERKVVSMLEGHTNAVTHAFFAHQGHILQTYSWDGTSRFWNAATGEHLLMANGSCLGFSPDDRYLAFADGKKLEFHEFAYGREMRTLHPSVAGNRTEDRNRTEFHSAEFSRDGRLVATGSKDGTRFWEEATGRELAHLPIGVCSSALFHPSGNSVITVSSAGLLRWPLVRVEGEQCVTIRCGPPRKFGGGIAMEPEGACWMPDHEQIVVNDTRNARVLIVDVTSLEDTSHETAPPAHVFASSHRRVNSVSVSPDGRWIAGGGHKELAIQVWNAESSERHAIPHSDSRIDTVFSAYFSPDNRWLVSAAQNDEANTGYHFYEVGTWKRRMLVKSLNTTTPRFTDDGRMAALLPGPRELLLVDAADGSEVARLAMNGRLSHPMDFSADGSRLAVNSDGKSILIWDLARLRAELTELGLDWDWPKVEAPRESPSLKPIEFQVDLGDLPHEMKLAERRAKADAHVAAGLAHSNANRFDQAKLEFEKALEQDPNHASALNQFAWMLLTDPTATRRDPARALELALRCVEHAPNAAEYWNTLGVAHYRACQWQLTIDGLLKAEALKPGTSFGHNAFFIAMSHWQLGDRDQARDWFDRAVEWSEKSHPNDAELRSFRTEAAKLLEK